MAPDRFHLVQRQMVAARKMRSAYLRMLLLRAPRRLASWLRDRHIQATRAAPARSASLPMTR
jgi:hypothetical protein